MTRALILMLLSLSAVLRTEETTVSKEKLEGYLDHLNREIELAEERFAWAFRVDTIATVLVNGGEDIQLRFHKHNGVYRISVLQPNDQWVRLSACSARMRVEAAKHLEYLWAKCADAQEKTMEAARVASELVSRVGKLPGQP